MKNMTYFRCINNRAAFTKCQYSKAFFSSEGIPGNDTSVYFSEMGHVVDYRFTKSKNCPIELGKIPLIHY